MAAEARLAYLSRASRQMSLASPSTSAHLSLTHTAHLRTNGRLSRPLTTEYCTVCGSRAVHISTIWPNNATKTSKAANTKKSIKVVKKKRQFVLHCHSCGKSQRTEFSRPSDSPTTIATTPPQDQPASVPLPIPPEKGEVEGKPSGKQRAKARKARTGLQALLEKSKHDSTPAPGFGLMDFMKKP